jgi:hypothetical protein
MIHRTNIRAVLSYLTAEEGGVEDKLFAVILLSGGEAFVQDEAILSHLIKLNCFGLLTNLSDMKPNKNFVLQVAGYFELFKALIASGSKIKGPILLHLNSLSNNVRELLSFVIKQRNVLQIYEMDSILNIIGKFISSYEVETEFHEIIYDALFKVFKLASVLEIRISQSRQGLKEYSSEKENLKFLSDFLTSILAQSSEISFISEDPESSKKSKQFLLFNKLIHELSEEEALASHASSPSGFVELDIEMALENKVSAMSNLVTSQYKQLIDLIRKLAKVADSRACYSFIFSHITQRHTIAKLIGSYVSSVDRNQKNYYFECMSLLVKISIRAAEKGLFDPYSSILSQIIMVLSNQNLSSQSIEIQRCAKELMSMMLQKEVRAKKHYIVGLQKLIDEYVSNRVDKGFYSEHWASVTVFMIHAVTQISRILCKSEEGRMIIHLNTHLFVKAYFIVIVDLHLLAPNQMESIQQMGISMPPLIETSDRYYSNSIIAYELYVQPEIPSAVEKLILKEAKSLFPSYEK